MIRRSHDASSRRSLAKIPILTNPLTIAPFPSSFPLPRFFCFSPSIWVQPVYTGKEKREQKERRELGSLGSGLKIHLLFARFSPRILTLFTMLFLSLFLSSFLPSRFFWISTPHANLARSPVATPSIPHLHQTVALTINK